MELRVDDSELTAALARCEAHSEQGGGPDELGAVFGSPTIKRLVNGVVEGTTTFTASWQSNDFVVDMGDMGDGSPMVIAQLVPTEEWLAEGAADTPAPEAGPTPTDWAAGRVWLDEWEAPFDIVRGEAFHRETLDRLVGNTMGTGVLIPVEVELVRETTNRHDQNAIRVEIDGSLVGYVGRDLALSFAPILDGASCERCRFPGAVCGGAIGALEPDVYVWLDRPLTEGPSLAPPADLAWRPLWPPDEALPDEQATRAATAKPVDRPAAPQGPGVITQD